MVHVSAKHYALWLHRLMAVGGLSATAAFMYTL
jgi:hypothetical protein